MIQNITVIGAGSTGHAVAAIMSQRGFQVTFHDDARFQKELDAVKEMGFIQLRGKVHGTGTPAKITLDPGQRPFSSMSPRTATRKLHAGLPLMSGTGSTSSSFRETWDRSFSGMCLRKWGLLQRSP